MTHVDDLGVVYAGPRPARRVVSLVPSLTETLASANPDGLVGATTWCTHPANLGIVRVRGTKNPDLKAIRALDPDVLVANREENRELDVRRLRESGVDVWVTDIRSVDDAVASIRRLLDGLGWDEPAWISEAEQALTPLPASARCRVAVPIWRDPWMVVGPGMFSSDMLDRLGYDNVFDDGTDRYPHADVAAIQSRNPDVVLLPDEPYVFTAEDGPEAFSAPTSLISGRLLTWYGPSMLDAARDLSPATLGI